MNNQLIKYDEACRSLAEARDVDEAKSIADKAVALQAYARQAHNPDLELMAAEIRLRAKLRIGELSKELDKAKHGGKGGGSEIPAPGKVVKSAALKAAGLSTSEAHRCEQLSEIPPKEFETYINQSREKRHAASTEEILKRVPKKANRENRINEINKKNNPLDTVKKYNVIYADPPWHYNNVVSESRRLENHYPTMTLDEICALPVQDMAADDCLLFLWATITELPGALRVMESWGFEYRSHQIWIKPSIGIGFWFRGQHELLLLGVKGKPPSPIEADRMSSVFEAKTGKHSQKPECVYNMIEKSWGSLSKIELFARNTRTEWDSWGNQVDS